MRARCAHVDTVKDVSPITPGGCGDCLETGGTWVHLRLCLECGHVGCCDNSPGKHATLHYHDTNHPVMRSFEANENWGWCYVHELFLEPAPQASAAASRPSAQPAMPNDLGGRPASASPPV